MQNIPLPSNLDIHLALSSEVDGIAQPLKKHFGITSLVYGKNYHDGTGVRLSNQPAWIEHYFENALYLHSGFEQDPGKFQAGHVVWAHLSHHQPVLQAAREFKIDHGITLIQPTPDGCEFYFLGTTPDKPQVANLLLNQLGFLQNFTFYFKEQAAGLLNKVNQRRIKIPTVYDKIVSNEQGLPYKEHSIDLEGVLRLKKIHLPNGLTLSAREYACAKLLARGLSTRLIAQALFISPRTVEAHLDNLKHKLRCETKLDLLRTLNQFIHH